MKLQLALDLLDPDEAMRVVEQAGSHVDVIEVGTSLLKLSGISLVDKIRELCPDKPIFLDSKIIDGPAREASLMARCRPEYYSMLAVASNAAVRTVLEIADENSSEVVFDLQSVAHPVERAQELESMGAKWVCVHKNADCGDDLGEAFKEFLDIRQTTSLAVALAGGVNLQSITRMRDELGPDLVVVGGAILKSDDYGATASSLREITNSRKDHE